MSVKLKDAVDALFSPEDLRIGNVKFFRGTSSTVTAEQLLEQFKSANAQIKSGIVKASSVIEVPAND